MVRTVSNIFDFRRDRYSSGDSGLAATPDGTLDGSRGR